MKGLTRDAIDKAESRDFAIGKGPLRPRDSATLLLLDRSGPELKVLMGKRHHAHAFMPGRFVFPGGRTDPADARVPVSSALADAEMSKMCALTGARFTPARARAIAMSAVRETYEEAGILIGERTSYQTRAEGWQAFAAHGVAPSLKGLRMVARAITPPGRVRRFDTRFLAAWRDEAGLELELLAHAAPVGRIVCCCREVLAQAGETVIRRKPTLVPGILRVIFQVRQPGSCKRENACGCEAIQETATVHRCGPGDKRAVLTEQATEFRRRSIMFNDAT